MTEQYLIINERKFNNYENLSKHGVIGEVRVEIINKDYKTRLKELVLQHHIYNNICWINGKDYNSNIYNKYLYLIEGKRICYEEKIKKIIFITLINDGYISDGFIKEQNYSKLEYYEEYRDDDMKVENNSFEPIIQTDDEYLTSDELITRLVDCGLIKEVAPNLYKNIYKIKPKDD